MSDGTQDVGGQAGLRERVARAISEAFRRCAPVAEAADAAIAEIRAAAVTITRDGPVTAIHDPSLPIDPAGILKEIRSWGAPAATEAQAASPGTQPTPEPPEAATAERGAAGEAVGALAESVIRGVVASLGADAKQAASAGVVQLLAALTAAGFVVVPAHATEAMIDAAEEYAQESGRRDLARMWRAMVRAATERR